MTQINPKIEKIIKPLYLKFFSDFNKKLKKDLSNCDSVLDLGCGFNSPIQRFGIPFKVGVELFEPYLEESKSKGIHNQYIKEDVTKVDFKPKSFDAVIIIDVLEHLSKEDGLKLIKKMETWAKKKIIIFTPNGYVYQDGYDKNTLQNHKSGWDVKELNDAGFKVFGINGYKKLRGYMSSVRYKPVFLWILISHLTQIITFHYPKEAFQLYAVKNVKI